MIEENPIVSMTMLFQVNFFALEFLAFFIKILVDCFHLEEL